MRARLLGTLAFVATFFVVSDEYFDPNIWLAAACQGVLIFLLGYYFEALTRHALIRRKLWGAATAFAGSGEAVEQARSLLSAIPELGLRPVGRLRSVDDLADMDRSDVEFVVTATKQFLRMVMRPNLPPFRRLSSYCKPSLSRAASFLDLTRSASL